MIGGAEADPLSLQVFLERFFGGLRDRGIGYCVLRNYSLLPVDNAGSDIDVLVKPERLEDGIAVLCAIPDISVTGCVRHGHCVSLFVPGVRWSGGDAIQVDFIYKLDWKGLAFLNLDDVLDRAHTLSGRPEIVRVPAAADEAVVSFFSSYLVGGWVKDRYQAGVRETFTAERQTVSDNLEPAFGASLAGRLIDTVIADDRARMLSMLPNLRRTLLFRSMRRAPFHSLGLLADHYGRVLLTRFTPRHVATVSILGPDGAGKSTLLKGLKTRLALIAKPIVVRHLKPDIFFRAHRRSHGLVTDPHGKPPRSALVSALKLVLWVIEMWIDRLFTVRENSPLEIWDRYYHDVLVDPKRYRYRGPMWFVHAIGWLAPKPDLFVILDAPAEVLQKRKQEVPPEETARQRKAYGALARRFEHTVIVDASRPVDMVVSDVAAAIIARLAEKTRRFLGSRT